jgi:GST-like protein
MKYQLFHSPGTGSQIILDALQLCKAPHEVIEVNYEKAAKGKDRRLKKVNPLSRLPTLVLPDQSVLTESGAILLHLAHRYPKAKLAPRAGSKNYDRFLRLLFIITGEIYPCFTFSDDPAEWVESKPAQKQLFESVVKHKAELWKLVDSLLDSKGPHALGKEFSCIDLYLNVMTSWRPGQKWFTKNAKRITAKKSALL